MPVGISVQEQLGEKVDLRFLGLSGWLRPAWQWINFTWGEIDFLG